MNDKVTRMIFATAALAAFAAVLASNAGAQVPEGNGTQAVTSQSDGWQAQSSGDYYVVPYLSQGQGVDETQFSGQASRTVAAQAAAQQAQTIPYLSQGIGVDASQFGGKVTQQQLTGVHAALASNGHESTSLASLPHGIQVEYPQSTRVQSLGLTGDSSLNRVAAPRPQGLTGDTALTRVPETAAAPTVSGGDDIDWTSFGAGAAMAALLAAAAAGVLLTARKRHSIGLP
ncbi:MAG TPA: hypothetical protein VH305_08075 [Gaiella sp.]